MNSSIKIVGSAALCLSLSGNVYADDPAVSAGQTTSHILTTILNGNPLKQELEELISAKSIMSSEYSRTETTSTVTEVRKQVCLTELKKDETESYIQARYGSLKDFDQLSAPLTKLFISARKADIALCVKISTPKQPNEVIIELGNKQADIAVKLASIESDLFDDVNTTNLGEPIETEKTSGVLLSKIESAQVQVDNLGKDP